MCELSSPESHNPRETDCGVSGVPSRSTHGEGHADIADLERTMIGLPGVPGDGMPGKNAQRKLGTTRGSPRRSRTAKASRISRRAAKSRCACERDGWGRLSDDGSGHDNPNRSEGPWGMWRHLMVVRNRIDQARHSAVPTMRSRGARRTDANQCDGQRTQGAGLSWTPCWEGPV